MKVPDSSDISQDVLLAIVASTLLILLLLTGIILAFYLNGRERIKQKMLLVETKLAYEKELRAVETEVVESTLTHLAQELHDNIGQLLTALHIQMENQKIDHPEMSEALKPLETCVTEINQQLRLLSRTLNNDYIGNIGLIPALQIETNRINGLRRMSVRLVTDGNVSNLERNQELMVFRIFQEIVQNALKHSKAGNFSVSVHTHNNDFRMEIRDDGEGFDPALVMASGKASGLRNIRKRAGLAGMDLQVISAPKEGSSFILNKRKA